MPLCVCHRSEMIYSSYISSSGTLFQKKKKIEKQKHGCIHGVKQWPSLLSLQFCPSLKTLHICTSSSHGGCLVIITGLKDAARSRAPPTLQTSLLPNVKIRVFDYKVGEWLLVFTWLEHGG